MTILYIYKELNINALIHSSIQLKFHQQWPTFRSLQEIVGSISDRSGLAETSSCHKSAHRTDYLAFSISPLSAGTRCAHSLS